MDYMRTALEDVQQNLTAVQQRIKAKVDTLLGSVVLLTSFCASFPVTRTSQHSPPPTVKVIYNLPHHRACSTDTDF